MQRNREYGDSDSYGGGFRSFAPVKVGEEIDVTIEAVGAKGDGIAKKNGFVLFVPGVKEGQNVRIRITKVLRKVGFAEVAGGSAASSEASSEQAPQEEGSSNSGEASEESSDEAPADSEEF